MRDHPLAIHVGTVNAYRADEAPGASPTPGLRLLDRYELVAPLARGGMGSVWQGKHLTLGSSIAVKFTHQGAGDARFLQEARIAANLGSPHIVQVIDLGMHEGEPFLVMELLEGETLQERLRALGRLSPAETVELIKQVASGLQVAHQAGVTHRDIKPSNIFICGTTGAPLCKILDFGVARAEDSEQTTTGELVGTPRYASPEQAFDSSSVGPASDLWSLGLVAFECIVGHSPFVGQTTPQIIRSLGDKPLPLPSQFCDSPPLFDAWFARATQSQPKDRFESAEELAQALAEALNDATSSGVFTPRKFHSQADKESPTVSLAEQDHSAKTRWFAAFALVLIGSALAFYFAAADKSERQEEVEAVESEEEEAPESAAVPAPEPPKAEVNVAADSPEPPKAEGSEDQPAEAPPPKPVTIKRAKPPAPQPPTPQPAARKPRPTPRATDEDDIWGLRK